MLTRRRTWWRSSLSPCHRRHCGQNQSLAACECATTTTTSRSSYRTARCSGAMWTRSTAYPTCSRARSGLGSSIRVAPTSSEMRLAASPRSMMAVSTRSWSRRTRRPRRRQRQQIRAALEAQRQRQREHKQALQVSEQLLAHERSLLDDVLEADGCSMDDYAAALERVIAEKLQLYGRLQNKLGELKKSLENEEATSKRLKRVPVF